jgi:hypothetical protein
MYTVCAVALSELLALDCVDDTLEVDVWVAAGRGGYRGLRALPWLEGSMSA